jgi:hypothetical protein
MIFSAKLFQRDKLIAADVVGEAMGQGAFMVGSIVLPASLQLERLDYRLVADNGDVFDICVVTQHGTHVEFFSVRELVTRPRRAPIESPQMPATVLSRHLSAVSV